MVFFCQIQIVQTSDEQPQATTGVLYSGGMGPKLGPRQGCSPEWGRSGECGTAEGFTTFD